MLVCLLSSYACPCGFFTDPKKSCHCNSSKIEKYLSKISGPLLDRIDIHIDVPALKYKEISQESPSESSGQIKKRIDQARRIQKERFKNERIYFNAHMNHRQTKKYCALDEQTKELLKNAMENLYLSARAYDKILKVSLTIADLEQKQNIEINHISEAIQYRCLDRQLWT